MSEHAISQVITREEGLALLPEHRSTRAQRTRVLQEGYPGYGTSVGWFNYDDENVREKCRQTVVAGFTAMKLKVVL